MHRFALRAGRILAAAAGAGAIGACSVTAEPASAASTPAAPAFLPLDLDKMKLDHHFLSNLRAHEGQLESYKLEIARATDATTAAGAAVRASVVFGHRACGHPTLVHGGALAAVLDDVCGVLFLSLGQSGFTANLNINYRAPVPAQAPLVVEARVDRIETARSGARKVYIKAVVKGADTGRVHVDAEALFIAKQDMKASRKLVVAVAEGTSAAAASAEQEKTLA